MTRAATLLAILLAGADAFAQAEQAPETPEQRQKREQRDQREQEAAERQRTEENQQANLPVPSEEGAPSPAPRWNLAVAPRLSVLLSDSAVGLSRVGYGLGLRLHFMFVKLGPLRLGAGFHFAYDRFGSGAQTLQHSSFAGVLLLDGLFGRARPFVGVGGGFSVADYQDPSQKTMGSPPMPFDIVGVVPLAAVTFGVGVRVYAGFEIGLRGDVELTFSSQAGGVPPRSIFSPGIFGGMLDLALRF